MRDSCEKIITVPRARDPLGKVIFITKLAEAVPIESESILLRFRNVKFSPYSSNKRDGGLKTPSTRFNWKPK